MLRHLELTPTIIAQQVKLLEQLPGWDISKLDGVLKNLKEKGIIDLSFNSSTERKISLDESVKTILNIDEEKLRSVLYGYISHQ